MAKLVEVLLKALNMKRFIFQWTVYYDELYSGIHANLNSGNDATMPKWSAFVTLSTDDRENVVFYFDPQSPVVMGTLAHINVSIVNKKKQKLKIHERNFITSDRNSIEARSLISKSVLLFEENEFITDNKLMLAIEVDCVDESKHNKERSSAPVSILDSSPNHLQSGLAQLFQSKQCSDVTLNVGDFNVNAHKAILIASSPVFAAMFQHDMQEQKLNSIAIPDICPEVLQEMLHFIYTGEIPNLDTMAQHLLKAADKYAIPNLGLKCEESLLANLSIETAAYTLVLADRYNAELLKAKTLDYIGANAKKVMETEEWKDLIKCGDNVQVLGEAFHALALKPKF